MKKILLKLSALALITGLIAGCASTGADANKMSQMEADLASARQRADAAMSAANDAQATAREALNAAQSAADASDRCRARCDRMFDQSMMK